MPPTIVVGKYFWLEYYDHIKERLRSLEREIKSLLASFQYLTLRNEAFIYYDELKRILEFIGKSHKNLSKDEFAEAMIMPELRFLFASTEYKIESFHDIIIEHCEHFNVENSCIIYNMHEEIYNLLNYLEQALAHLKYGINQLTGGEFLKQTIYYHYSFTSSLTDIPSQEKILCSVSSVVNNYSELIFGNQWLKEHKIRPIAIAGFGDYGIYPHIYIAHYPIADTFRTRFWTSFGHEMQHEKNYIADIILKKQKDLLKNDRKYPERYHQMLNRKIKLLFNNTNNFKIWEETYNEIIKSIRESIGHFRYAQRLLDEIVCDVASVLLSGPADFLSLLSAYVGSLYSTCAENIWDPHPPIYFRFKYSLYIVDKILNLKEFIEDYFETMNSLEIEFEKFNNYLNSHPRHDIFEKIYDKNFDKIVELSKLSITSYLKNGEKIFFNSDKYDQSVQVKESLLNGRSIADTSKELEGDPYMLEPRVILMAGWLKRLDEFKNLDEFKRSNLWNSSELYIKYNETKSRFYPSIIDYLCCYYKKHVRGD